MTSPHPLRLEDDAIPAGMVDAAHAHCQIGSFVPEDHSVPDCHVRRRSYPITPITGATRRLVSSYAGPFRKLLLAIPAYAAGTPALAAVYRAYAKVLPAYTHFVILTHKSARKKVARWFGRAGHLRCRSCRMIDVADEVAFSMWAEDPYVVGRDGRQHVFVEPLRKHGGADGLIGSLVAEDAGLDRTTSPLVFQGGNVLIGDDFYFVGADYLQDSLHSIEKDHSIADANRQLTPAIKRKITEQFLDASRVVHYIACKQHIPSAATSKVRIRIDPQTTVIGTEHFHRSTRKGSVQPLFHLDMFITFAGREPDGRFRILVGDPRLAAQTAGLEAMPVHAMAGAFDEIAARLSRHPEFAVTRNPLPYVFRDTVEKQKGKPDRYHRWWYFATANNALVENRGRGKRRVWLPSYGHGKWRELRATDRLNKAIWEQLGFTVTMLPDFNFFAWNMGAAHCIKKYLER